MINKRKQKRRLKKHFKRMKKEKLKRAWKNIFVKAGILNEKST